jgi:hypothetical protein
MKDDVFEMPHELKELSVVDIRQELESRKKCREKDAIAIARCPALKDFEDSALIKALRHKQKAIYGVDDRVDIFQLADPQDIRDASSVVALIDAASVTDNGDGTSSIATSNFGTSQNLCASEPFRSQPIAAYCSGFLVAPDVVATAAHCVTPGSVINTRFVFGFRMINGTTAQTRIPNTEIYNGVDLIGRRHTDAATDWALVRLDRPVPDHPVVAIRRTGQIPANQRVHVVGHPSGLPAKFAGGANVLTNTAASHFVANLDTYGGNSGSPVFNSGNRIVEGVLVRGETDFVANGGCNVSLVCPASGCQGEDCVRTTEFSFALQALDPVGAALLHPNGHAYFFRANQYQRYDFAYDVVDKIGRIGVDGWTGLWSIGINSAVMHPNGKAYFFRGSRYQRYDFQSDRIDKEANINTDGWRGLWTDGIDAAVTHPNGKAYFFKGAQYQRFDFQADRVDKTARIDVDGWSGLTTNGIDAAVNHPNGKAYFFFGNRYQRFDFGIDCVDKTGQLGVDGWWTVRTV